MRSQPKTPQGKVIWREVKVAILARLGEKLTGAGKAVVKLKRRRLVAVLGNLEAFIPQVKLEAHKQSFESASKAVWLSDDGRGFWRVYHQCFAHCAVAVLDFYHAAGHLWRAATVLLSTQTDRLKCLEHWHHALRYGHHSTVLAMLTALVNTELLSVNPCKRSFRFRLTFNVIMLISAINNLRRSRFLWALVWCTCAGQTF